MIAEAIDNKARTRCRRLCLVQGRGLSATVACRLASLGCICARWVHVGCLLCANGILRDKSCCSSRARPYTTLASRQHIVWSVSARC